MNLSPEIWHLPDGTPIYMYTIQQYEYFRDQAMRPFQRDRRSQENPFTSAVGGKGHMKKPHVTGGV